MTLSEWQSGCPTLKGWYLLKAAKGSPFVFGMCRFGKYMWGYWDGRDWFKCDSAFRTTKIIPNKNNISYRVSLIKGDQWQGITNG